MSSAQRRAAVRQPPRWLRPEQRVACPVKRARSCLQSTVRVDTIGCIEERLPMWSLLRKAAGVVWSSLRQAAGVVSSALPVAYRAAITLVVLVFVVALGFVTVKNVWNDHIVIEPLSVPHKLEDDGYTGAIVAQRLHRQVVDIVGSVASLLSDPTPEYGAAERVTFSNEEALESLSAIQVPSSGLSLRSVSGVLRGFFGRPERKITGKSPSGDRPP